jgi:hypothetical protein
LNQGTGRELQTDGIFEGRRSCHPLAGLGRGVTPVPSRTPAGRP